VDSDFRNRELRFSVFGPSSSEHFVAAELFTRKLREIIAALKRADKAVNSLVAHHYVISHLKMGSAEVGILEQPAAMAKDHPPISSVSAFIDCGVSINRGDFAAAIRYSGLAQALYRVSRDSGEKFSHIDLYLDDAPILRVDDFFERQTATFLAAEPRKSKARFTGSSVDAFDGYLKEVDLRGQLWRGKLVLAGTKKELDCIFRGPTLKNISDNLDQRVWAEGLAIYREESALPSRVEISRIEPIKKDGNLLRWRGELEADERAEWGGSFDDLDQQ
jgi:hypothetical protein